MDKADVSVCIVTFNQREFIGRCLESVLSQAPLLLVEILVGDDGSTDGTREIIASFVERYPLRIIPLFHEKNLGASANYRTLIAMAKGDFIAHLDGDDYWMPGKLQRQLEVLQHSDRRPSAVVSNALVVDRKDRPLGFFSGSVPEFFGLDYLISGGNFICHGSLLYKAAFRDVILSTEVPFIDYQLLVRLASVGELCFLDEILVVYRSNSVGSMRVVQNALVVDNYWRALRDAQSLGASNRAFRASVALFTERIFIIGLSALDIRTISYWLRRIDNESAIGVRLQFFVALIRLPCVVLRYFRKKIAQNLFRRRSILYPRR